LPAARWDAETSEHRAFVREEGDPGFADLASMLNLDEKSSAKAVPVAGLDPGDVWEVGETGSRAING